MIDGPKHKMVIHLEPVFEVPEKYKNATGFVPVETVGSELSYEVTWHPEECDKLKYNESCWLDHLINDIGIEDCLKYSHDLPTELGEYWLWPWSETHYGYDYTEYDEGLACEKIGPLPPGYCYEIDETGMGWCVPYPPKDLTEAKPPTTIGL